MKVNKRKCRGTTRRLAIILSKNSIDSIERKVSERFWRNRRAQGKKIAIIKPSKAWTRIRKGIIKLKEKHPQISGAFLVGGFISHPYPEQLKGKPIRGKNGFLLDYDLIFVIDERIDKKLKLTNKELWGFFEGLIIHPFELKLDASSKEVVEGQIRELKYRMPSVKLDTELFIGDLNTKIKLKETLQRINKNKTLLI